ncbi:FAD-binding dehydrogenase, partial [Sesbania bispinosa]
RWRVNDEEKQGAVSLSHKSKSSSCTDAENPSYRRRQHVELTSRGDIDKTKGVVVACTIAGCGGEQTEADSA